MKAFFNAILEISREIIHGNLDADSAEPGNVTPATVSVVHSPDEISKTFDAGATSH